MGMVVSFVPKSSAPGQSRATGEPAPVIIFPGIRYEQIKAEAEVSGKPVEPAPNPAH
ncbi:MAG: hypothetical protein KF874_05645 [Rhizobiaceae bacterium]|nr:hypothetical protein [Rhizobiaceae bacterium]